MMITLKCQAQGLLVSGSWLYSVSCERDPFHAEAHKDPIRGEWRLRPPLRPRVPVRKFR